MRNIIKGSIVVILGAVVLRDVYATGYNKGVKYCKDQLEFAFDILKAAEGKES